MPGDYSREGRVRLLGEAFRALMAGEMPSDEARLFLAAGGVSWLESGGDLARDYWKVTGRQGSNHTPAAIWALLQSASRSATDREQVDTMQSDSERSDSHEVP